MTCIVAIIGPDGVVHMGADSAGVGGLSLQIRRDPKVFVKDNMVFGCTSSFRMIQLLRFSLVVPKRHSDVDLYQWMCTDFIDAVRKCLIGGGYASKLNEVESGGTFLVGVAGRLFVVYNDFQVGERDDLIGAVGCGEDLALGSLHQSRGDVDLRRRLVDALSTAERFCAGVRGPFVFVESKPC